MVVTRVVKMVARDSNIHCNGKIEWWKTSESIRKQCASKYMGSGCREGTLE